MIKTKIGKMKDMSKMNILMFILLLLLPICSCFLTGFFYSFNSEVERETFSSFISQESQNNIDKKAFLKLSSYDNESNVNNSRTMYLNTWRDNFVYNTQFLCSSKESSYEPEKYNITNSCFESRGITLVDACNYSSQKDLLRFETLNMNIYSYRERQYETYVGNCDGFVYIPDYIADKIIENSNGLFRFYEDLIPDGAISEELENFLILKISSSTKTYDFRIANIFHVVGYNKQYFKDGPSCEKHLINDNNTGIKMLPFLGDFCVGYCYKMMKENNFSLGCCLDSKQYSLIDYLNIMSSNGKNALNGFFYNVNESNVSTIVGSDFAIEQWDKKSFEFTWMSVMSIFVLVVPFIIFVLSFLFIERNKFSNQLSILLFSIQSCLLILLEIIVTLLNKFIPLSSYLHKLFSKYFGINALILIIGIMLILFFVIKKHKKENYE